MNTFLRKLRKAITNPSLVLQVMMNRERIARLFPDKVYLQLKYKLILKEKLNLDNPENFNEKMQWLKLYNRKPEYTQMVDKYEVRRYIAEKIGEEYLIPLLGVWDNPAEIDFSSFPEQFVLKCTHNSGLGMCICKDKSVLDIDNARRGLKKGLKQDYFITSREWPYKNVKPRIIAEKFMVDESGDELKDYKFMCFNGKVQCCFVCTDRFKDGLKITVFDNDWKEIPIKVCKKESKENIAMPHNLKKMIELAEVLADNMAFVRIDFYEIQQRIYFGEITFFPESGYEVFEPDSWNYSWGEMIKLNM